METYSVGDIIIALNISSTTVRNWTDHAEFRVFFSSRAKREREFENAKQREYTEDDLHVLNTIRTQKTHKNSWEDVAVMLADGFRDKELPESSVLVMPETRGEAFQLISVARAQIDTLQKRVEELEGELKSKEQALSAEREARIQDIERLAVKMVREDMKDLYKTIGRLEYILKQAGIDPEIGKQLE